MQEWGRLCNDPQYKVVEQTTVGPWWISTVWLGLNHAYGPQARPMIFESMVFASGQWSDQDAARYSTEAEAWAGHQRLVKKWRRRKRS